MKTTLSILGVILLVKVAFAQNPYAPPPSQLMIFQNMPGENEIVKVAPLDVFDPGPFDNPYKVASNVVFVGTVMENSKKKLLIGRTAEKGKLLIWVKAVEVGEIANIIDLSKIYNEDVDTAFILCYNTDTSSNNNRIGAIKFDKNGNIKWAKYYTADSSVLKANSFGYRNRGSSRYTLVGCSKYDTITKALIMALDTITGHPLLSSETQIENSNYQEYEFIDRSEYYHYKPGIQNELSGVSGVFRNGAFGIDVFLGKTVFSVMGDQFNSQCRRVGGGVWSPREYICFQNGDSNIGYFCQSNADPYIFWGNTNRHSFPMKIYLQKTYKWAGELNVFLLISADTNGAAIFNNGTPNNEYYYNNFYFFSGAKLVLNDYHSNNLGGNGWGPSGMQFNQICGSFCHATLPWKTAFIGELTTTMGCENRVRSLIQEPNISVFPLPGNFISNSINILASDINYLDHFINPTLVSVCVPIPKIVDSINFTGAICNEDTVFAKIKNYHGDNTISVKLNGTVIPYNAIDSTINLSGLLSAPADTLQVIYQGLIYSSQLDSIFLVNDHPTILIQADPADAIIFKGDSVSLTASGAENIMWSHAVENGVYFYPDSTTIYNVVGTNANGCESSSSIQVVVLVEKMSDEIIVYPVPAINQLHIIGLEDGCELKIFNSAGQTIWYKELGVLQSKKYIHNISGLPRGVYTLQVKKGSQMIQKKWVKE